MNKYKVRLNFFWDDGDDMNSFVIVVPKDITIQHVRTVLLNAHSFLDNEDASDYYGVNGRNPESLINYVCDKYGWKSEDLEFDIDLNLN